MNKWLLLGGTLSVIGALMHVAIIFGGADWYRFFGAGEGMARAAEAGSSRPALITCAIAALLLIAGAYAFSGAGLLPRLPLLRTGLTVISAVYLLRAMAPVAILALVPAQMSPFVIWSSLIVLLFGTAYAVGTWTAWPLLRG